MKPSVPSKESKSDEHQRIIEQRRNRFANLAISPIVKPIESDQPFLGTCETLEKNYLRLTSAPHASAVRPLAILERAFSYVMNKYQSNNDWSYVNNQLKSIRQDLMVQSVRNDFTVLVYEENARIALEMSDRDQFIQCQTQLEILYDSGCCQTHLMEFLIYRLLYALLINEYKKVNRILIDIAKTKRSHDDDHVDIALQFCSAFRRKNFVKLFLLYRSLPRLARCLVDLFLDIYRQQLIGILIWGFTPTFPVEIVTTMLAYQSEDICREHLRSFGVIFSEQTMSIDCKTSRVNFERK